MRKWRIWSLLIMGAIALAASAIKAKPVAAAEYPQVGELTPFSREANFMSLAGYLRYLVNLQDNVWLSRAEAQSIVEQQGGH